MADDCCVQRKEPEDIILARQSIDGNKSTVTDLLSLDAAAVFWSRKGGCVGSRCPCQAAFCRGPSPQKQSDVVDRGVHGR